MTVGHSTTIHQGVILRSPVELSKPCKHHHPSELCTWRGQNGSVTISLDLMMDETNTQVQQILTPRQKPPHVLSATGSQLSIIIPVGITVLWEEAGKKS